MKVVRWTSGDEELEVSFGSLGGWFNAGHIHGPERGGVGHRWRDYIDGMEPKGVEYAEALRAEILRLGLTRGGDWHQGEEGTPVFSDGTCASFSYRAWGDLLAAVWSEEHDLDYTYMSFYMDDFGQESGPPRKQVRAKLVRLIAQKPDAGVLAKLLPKTH